jgi:hypothetical protein
MVFEMTYRTLDGRIVRGGMAHDAKDHPAVFVTPGGSTITKRDWPRFKGALDKAIKPFNGDLVRMKDHPEAFDNEDDEERGVEALRRWLRAHTGLAESVISEACDLAASEMEPSGEDYIPASGLKSAGGMGGRLSNARSRLGEGSRAPLGTLSTENRSRSPLGTAEFRSSLASDASFDQRYPGVRERLGRPVHGTSQYDPPPARSKRERKLAADASADGAGDRLTGKFGAHFAEVGVGPWPKRL